jgi:hypothetical protein
VADKELTDLLGRAPHSFIGTVEHVGAATASDVAIDERTAVVHVDYVLHGPEMLLGIEGQRVTVQLAAGVDPPPVGETIALFVEGRSFGESIVVSEVGRLAVETVEPYVSDAIERGERTAFVPLERQLESDRLREHARGSDAVVIGRAVKLEKVPLSTGSEHDPDWWKATLQVDHVESGNVQADSVEVLYANSLDVSWYAAPKPKASQQGLWILHATEGALREAAPFQILHPGDYQPVQRLDALRETGG